jgi:hypothetical protein
VAYFKCIPLEILKQSKHLTDTVTAGPKSSVEDDTHARRSHARIFLPEITTQCLIKHHAMKMYRGWDGYGLQFHAFLT